MHEENNIISGNNQSITISSPLFHSTSSREIQAGYPVKKADIHAEKGTINRDITNILGLGWCMYNFCACGHINSLKIILEGNIFHLHRV